MKVMGGTKYPIKQDDITANTVILISSIFARGLCYLIVEIE